MFLNGKQHSSEVLTEDEQVKFPFLGLKFYSTISVLKHHFYFKINMLHIFVCNKYICVFVTCVLWRRIHRQHEYGRLS